MTHPLQKRIADLEADLKTALLCQSGELASQVFAAHHQLFLDQPGYAKEILRELLDTELAEPLKRHKARIGVMDDLEEVCIGAISYVGLANYAEREMEAKDQVRAAFAGVRP